MWIDNLTLKRSQILHKITHLFFYYTYCTKKGESDTNITLCSLFHSFSLSLGTKCTFTKFTFTD